MSFKDQISTDLKTFINDEEFAETASYEGNPILVLFDKVAEDNFLIDVVSCRIEDVVNISSSSSFVISNITYTASSWISREGIMEIVLNVQN